MPNKIQPFISSAIVLVISSAIVLVLSGCMGGNNGSASPPMTADIRTDQLYANIAATPNQLYAGFAIDTDNPVISSYTGQTALNSFLAKQPDISEFNRLASPPEYVSGAWIKGTGANLNMIDEGSSFVENGKYFLWGYLSESLPQTASLSYDMHASWRCTGCSNPSGTASGTLLLNLAKNQAEFSLDSGEFSLRTALEFSQKNQLQRHTGSDSKVRVKDKSVQMDKLAVRGGIFGPEGQNAGLVFGFHNTDTKVTGIATGQRK